MPGAPSPDQPQPGIQTPDRFRPVRNVIEKIKHPLGKREETMVKEAQEAIAQGKGEEGLEEIAEEAKPIETVQPTAQNGQATETSPPNLEGTEAVERPEVNPTPNGVQADITAEALGATVQGPVTTPSETTTELPNGPVVEVSANPVTGNSAETPQTMEQKPRTPQEVLELLPPQTRAELAKWLEVKKALTAEPQANQRVTDIPIRDVQNQLRDLLAKLPLAKDDQIPQIIEKINTFRSENHLAKADLQNQQREDETSRDKKIADTRAEIDQEFGPNADLNSIKRDLEWNLDVENGRSGVIQAFRGKHRAELQTRLDRVNQTITKRDYAGDDLRIKIEDRKRLIDDVESFDIQATVQKALAERLNLTVGESLVYRDVVQNSAEISRKLAVQAFESLTNDPDFMADLGWNLSEGDFVPEDLYEVVTHGTEIVVNYGNYEAEYSESSSKGQLAPKFFGARRILNDIEHRATEERSFISDVTVMAQREAMDYYEDRLREFFAAAGLPAEGQSAFYSFEARRKERRPIETERLQETSEYWMKIVNNPSIDLNLPSQVVERVSSRLNVTGSPNQNENFGSRAEKSDETEESSNGKAAFEKVISIVRLKQEENGEELLHLYNTDQDAHIREIAGRALMYVGRKENHQLLGTVADRLGADPRLKEAFINASLPTESLNHQYQIMKILIQNPSLAEKFIQGDTEMIQHLLKITGREDYEQVGKILSRLLTQDVQSPREVFKYMMMAESSRISFDEKFTVSTIPGIDGHLQWAKMSPERRKQFLDASGDFAEELASSDSVSTEFLTWEYKLLLVRNTLKHVIEDSQNPEKKQQADSRNRELVKKNPQPLLQGTFLHGANVNCLTSVLTNGDKAGDFLGLMAHGDGTPYGADFSAITGKEVEGVIPRMQNYTTEEALSGFEERNEFDKIYSQSIAAGYGAKPELERRQSRDAKSGDVGVTLIFDRSSQSAFLKGTEYPGHMDPDMHRLVLVGFPSTEVSGLIVNGRGEETLVKAKEDIVQNGFYIPIYDVDGTLLFTPEQYDAQRAQMISEPTPIAA